MKIKLFQVDTFSDKVFSDKLAIVCMLEEWVDDMLLQSITNQNCHSETAFIIKRDNKYELRWFTPLVEVDLCGHAILDSAFVILNELEPSLSKVVFKTKSGTLTVQRKDGMLEEMDFQAYNPKKPCDPPDDLLKGLGAEPQELLFTEDYVAVYDNLTTVRQLKSDSTLFKTIPLRWIIVTAPEEQSDFVSRFIAPKMGIDEDPVTGSTHCSLTPYRAQRLGKTKLHTIQVSKRGDELYCELKDNRVLISGKAIKVPSGEMFV